MSLWIIETKDHYPVSDIYFFEFFRIHANLVVVFVASLLSLLAIPVTNLSVDLLLHNLGELVKDS